MRYRLTKSRSRLFGLAPIQVRLNPKCDRTITVYGYLRGTNLKASSRCHIAGCGDYDIGELNALPDPCPHPSTMKKRSLNEKVTKTNGKDESVSHNLLLRPSCKRCFSPQQTEPHSMPFGSAGAPRLRAHDQPGWAALRQGRRLHRHSRLESSAHEPVSNALDLSPDPSSLVFSEPLGKASLLFSL